MNTVKIVDPKQTMLYIKHGVKPIDIYVENDRIIYVFTKAETRELYTKWLNRELK